MNSTHTIALNLNRNNIRQISILIGWSYMAMFFLGIFAEFAVSIRLIDWQDSLLTFTNIRSSLGLYDSSIVAWLFIILLDVVLAIAFYLLFHQVHLLKALLMTGLRLVYVSIKGFALVGLLLARDMYATDMSIHTEQITPYAAQAMQWLRMHHYGFGIGLIFFGLHLMLLAMLLFRVYNFPRLITWTLLIAGAGYAIHSLVSFFAPDFELLKNTIIGIFILPMTFAELALGLWLWIRYKSLLPHQVK